MTDKAPPHISRHRVLVAAGVALLVLMGLLSWSAHQGASTQTPKKDKPAPQTVFECRWADGPITIDAKVILDGTLNRWQGKDKGWSVEGRIPWKDFFRTGGRPAIDERWKFALCRYDYSVDFEGPELSTCAPLNSQNHPDFHRFEDY